jgi:hypothetical protein
MPKGLKLALALSISLAEVMVPEVELLEVVKVKRSTEEPELLTR